MNVKQLSDDIIIQLHICLSKVLRFQVEFLEGKGFTTWKLVHENNFVVT
jgi:hypothetical protein